MPTVAGWSCATPTVGLGGTVSCTQASFAVGSSVFTLTVNVGAAVASGTVLSNTATVTSTTGDSNAGNNSATATTTVAASADLSVTVTDSPDPVQAGSNLTYTITVGNAGPALPLRRLLGDNTCWYHNGFDYVTWLAVYSACQGPVPSTVQLPGTSLALVAAFYLGRQRGRERCKWYDLNEYCFSRLSTTSDPVTGNNSATATTTVTASADLSSSP